MVERKPLPTSFSKPLYGASLKRNTAVCAEICSPTPLFFIVAALPTTAHVEKSCFSFLDLRYTGPAFGQVAGAYTRSR